jgi:hypothetical protein
MLFGFAEQDVFRFFELTHAAKLARPANRFSATCDLRLKPDSDWPRFSAARKCGCFWVRYNSADIRARNSRLQTPPIAISKRQNPVFHEAGDAVAGR